MLRLRSTSSLGWHIKVVKGQSQIFLYEICNYEFLSYKGFVFGVLISVLLIIILEISYASAIPHHIFSDLIF